MNDILENELELLKDSNTKSITTILKNGEEIVLYSPYYVKLLEQRIDKAIEYIKENKASLPMGRDEFTCEMRYSDDVVLAHKLLEILGDKENE